MKKKKEKEKIMQTIQKLNEELEKQQKNHTVVMQKLKDAKETLLQNCVEKGKIIETMYQYCILPRVFCSYIDALYCARFCEVLLELGTQHFSIFRVFETVNFVFCFLFFVFCFVCCCCCFFL